MARILPYSTEYLEKIKFVSSFVTPSPASMQSAMNGGHKTATNYRQLRDPAPPRPRRATGR
ncbi:hypothetical protein VCV18_009267 [Metarhizium anisopliae]